MVFDVRVIEILACFLIYLAWILLTYSSFCSFSRLVRVLSWGAIAVGLLYLLHFSIGYAVMLGFLCIGLLYAYDEQAMNASRWAKDESMRKDLSFMGLKTMPIWLILGLDVFIFFALYGISEL